MKVDSSGQPVNEGTFGLYLGQSARVKRTFIDPVKDDEGTQQTIGEGGYIVDLGEDGEALCDPNEFTATYDGVNVKAQDGQLVKVGDVVTYAGGDRKARIRHLYPIGTLKGMWCAEIENLDGTDLKGGGPTGQLGLPWGSIDKVVERSSSKRKAAATSTPKGEGWKAAAGTVYIGDTVKTCTQYPGAWTVEGGDGTNVVLLKPADDVARVTKKQDDLSASRADGCMRFGVSRIKELVFRATDGEVQFLDIKLIKVGDIITFLHDDMKTVLEGTIHVDYAAGKKAGFDMLRVKLGGPDKKHLGQKEGTEWWVTTGKVLTCQRQDEDGTLYDPFEALGFNDDELGNTNDNDEDQLSTEEGSDDSMAPTKQTSVGKVDVIREGSKILLPVGMPTRTAIKELTRQLEQDEMDVAILEIIDGFPLDAAHAFVQSLALKYGWVNALPTPGFFGPQPPVMIGVQVDPDGRTVQIPWGQIGIPGVTGTLATGIQFKDGRPCFCIQGTVKQKDKGVVNEIALMTKEYLRDHSIYKGKAVRMKFPEPGSKAFSPLDHQPKFIQTTDVRPDELIFSKDVHRQISVNIWTPIQALAAVRAARVPLKRGVLLYGRYGVGKTLLASVTARMAVQAGVTFIDLVDSNQLPQAVEFGRMLGGMVVIFAEDIDRCDENGERTDAFNQILNTVDGLTSKTDEVMIVYTTNHIERISKAMLRQGRIDKVIHIKEPDADAAVRLIRLYARHMLAGSEDLTAVGTLLGNGDFIPAAIREIVEQSKLAAIERGDVHNITAEDLLVTVENTHAHMQLLRETPKDDRSELEKLGQAVGHSVVEAFFSKWESGDGDQTVGDIVDSVTKRKAA